MFHYVSLCFHLVFVSVLNAKRQQKCLYENFLLLYDKNFCQYFFLLTIASKNSTKCSIAHLPLTYELFLNGWRAYLLILKLWNPSTLVQIRTDQNFWITLHKVENKIKHFWSYSCFGPRAEILWEKFLSRRANTNLWKVKFRTEYLNKTRFCHLLLYFPNIIKLHTMFVCDNTVKIKYALFSEVCFQYKLIGYYHSWYG